MRIGFLPGGRPRIVEMSRSPKSVMAKVRGMGVAVMTMTWGVRSGERRSVWVGGLEDPCAKGSFVCAFSCSAELSAESGTLPHAETMLFVENILPRQVI